MKFLQRFQKSILFLLKVVVFASLFLTFFLVFREQYPWVFEPSRTSGVTMLSFAVLIFLFSRVYGGYAIGVQKSKSIIYSLVTAVFLTDFITHVQLCIMLANLNGERFVYASPWLLFAVFAIQCSLIIVLTYFGNFLYFRINKPAKCCVITAENYDPTDLIRKIGRYKKQYEIISVVKDTDRNVYDAIAACETVFFHEVPIESRTLLIEYCYEQSKNIYYTLEMCDIVALSAKRTVLDDKSLMSFYVKELTLEQRFVKRTMDIGVSLVALILASTFMLILAAAIKLDDGGKVFFKQKRATKNGKVFEVYKFRTMREENQVNKSVTANDDRITKVGAILRKFRLDELPQVFNILNGDMSIVGPRPEMLENIDKYTEELPEFRYRLRAKAGLTGLAQIAGKYNTSPKDKLILDLTYIEKYSLLSDISLMFRTILVLFKSEESTEAFVPGESPDKSDGD